MSINSVESPFPIFTDVDGSPLESGYVYIGETSQNPEVVPVTVYWDSSLITPATQPIRTIGGYPSRAGTAARLYVQGDYSISVRDKNSALVFSSPVATDILISINSLTTISGLIGYTNALDNISVNVLGYHTANDGGGGLFNWDSTVDKSTANAGTIIDPSVSLANQGTGVGLGCWMRQYDEYVDIRGFGAKDGQDSTTAFNNADSITDDIYIPRGTFLASAFTLTNKNMIGPGTIQWIASVSPLLTISGDGVTIDGITFDGDSIANSPDMIVTTTAPNLTINNCTFINGYDKGVVLDVASSPFFNFTNNTFKDWGLTGSCDCVSVRSPDAKLSGNTFDTMLAAGHCIRLGLYSGDSQTTAVDKCIVSNNTFKDTLHVGVTCELLAIDVLIADNTFDNLNQAIKCESAVGGSSDVTITGNIIKNIVSETALNLSIDNVIFNNNHCYNLAGGPFFGNDFTVIGNYFEDCGSATAATIASTSGSTGGNIKSNIIKNARFRAISISGNSSIVGNIITNSTEIAIALTGLNNVISGNTIDGATYAFRLTSTCESTVIKDNVGANLSSGGFTGYSFTATGFQTVLIKDNVGMGELITAYTIATGVIDVSYTSTYMTVNTEGGAPTDDLDTINGGKEGQVITLRTTSVSRDVTVKDGTGNIRLAGDFLLDSTSYTLTLIYNVSLGWVEVSRSAN